LFKNFFIFILKKITKATCTPLKNKNILYSQCATSSEKGESACHISENAQSAGLRGYSKKNKNRVTYIISQGGKPKVTYITGGKSLLTLFSGET